MISKSKYKMLLHRIFKTFLFCNLLLGISTISYAKNSNSTVPTAVPTAPSIDWMQSQWKSGEKVPLVWHLYWGVTGTSWEVLANNESVYKSTSFETNSANAQSGKALLSLKDGGYTLNVKLCNGSECSQSPPTKISVGADLDKVPNDPQISYIGNITQGSIIPVRWNMWYGNTGSSWEVWLNNKQVHTSQQFTINDAYTQAGEVNLNSGDYQLSSGTQALTVKLCNGSKCGIGTTSFTISGGTPPEPTPPGKPVIDSIPDSTTKQVNLKWNMTSGIKGTAWHATDEFNGTTLTIVPTSSVFTESGSTQSGSATLSLEEGTHKIIVVLCTSSSTCTSSDPSIIKVTLPTQPVPGVPALNAIPNSTTGKLNVSWKTTGAAGTYWQILNGSTILADKITSFSDSTKKSGTSSLAVDNGTYAVSVKLCNDKNICSTSNIQNTTVSGASDKKAFFISYYPTWFSPYFNTFCDQGGRYYDYVTKTWLACTPYSVLPDNTITSASLLAGGIPNYVTHVILSFAKLNAMRNYTGISTKDGDLKVLGIDFTPSSASVKESIRVLKKNNPGTKVLLALGGATFNSSWQNVTQADIDGAAKLIVDLGLDGLDVDYELSGTTTAIIDEYYNSIVAMRKAVDKANLTKTDGRAILTVPGWSTGADCTAQTQGTSYAGCSPSKISYWGGNAGRERLVLQGRGAASMFDIVSIMSYDASYEHYDPVTAYANYKQIVKPGTPVALGIQPSPDEGWGSARTFVNDRGINNDCVGNTVLQDQYGVKTPGTFSVQRFADLVKKTPGDGLMMWSLFASRSPMMCGTAKLSTVTELGQGVSQYLGIGNDRTKQIDYNTAIIYGRRLVK